MPASLPITAMSFCLLAILLPGAASAFDTQQLTEDDKGRLIAGNVLVEAKAAGSSSMIVTAAIDVSAYRNVVWNVMTDCAQPQNFVPDLKRCRVLEKSADGKADIRDHIVEWGWLLPKVRSVFRSDCEKPESIAFEKVEGDFTELFGKWRLESLDGDQTTRITYEAKVAMPLLVPASLVRGAIETDVPKTLNALRDEILRQVQR